MNPEFSRQIFRKVFKCKISRKSFQWEPSHSMRKDGRTDIRKLKVAFRNIANVPKKCHKNDRTSEAAILRNVSECYVAKFERFKMKNFKLSTEQPLRCISHKDAKIFFQSKSTHFYERVY